MRRCSILAAAGLTAMFASSPLSFSTSPSSSLPQLTVSKAEAWVTYRRARVATRRAYRYGAYHVARPYYGSHSVYGGVPSTYYSYPYAASNNAYSGVYAAPAGVGWGWGRGWGWGGWHRPHWGPARGWHWWR